ncbi:MAG: FAD-binding domain-containing protein [Pseudomonadota bacterium]
MKDLPEDADDAQSAEIAFPPHRAAALERLRDFLPHAGRDYANMRNHDLPGHPHVSGLSPYLRHRALTEAEVAGAVLERFAPSTAEKFLQEVCWRTYWKGWLERRPSVWTQYLTDLGAAQNRLATESGLRAEWEAACEGRTGIAPFDHWAEELSATGYLHNHARMWFASIWIHTLRLPWVLGADFFLRHLLDGDPASNTLGWRWVAGLHTRGKTYQARASNIGKYTGGRFDTRELGHQLASHAEPLDAPAPPSPADMPEDGVWGRNKRTALLLTEDDLHPDFLFARGFEPDGAAILVAPAGRSPLSVAKQVKAFTHALAEDAAARISERCPCAEVTDDPEAIATWIRTAGFEQVVTPYAPVGPARTQLDRLAGDLDIPVIRPIRAWDQAAWPYATAGFFKLKSKIPGILSTIAQDTGA